MPPEKDKTSLNTNCAVDLLSPRVTSSHLLYFKIVKILTKSGASDSIILSLWGQTCNSSHHSSSTWEKLCIEPSVYG